MRSAQDAEWYVEAVLALVEQIPPGRATTYSLLAEVLGRGGPRQVGRALAMYGAPVPWWRVVRADGSLPESHQRAALEHYRAESTPLSGTPSNTRGPRNARGLRNARVHGNSRGLRNARGLRVDLDQAIWIPDAPPLLPANPIRPTEPGPSQRS